MSCWLARLLALLCLVAAPVVRAQSRPVAIAERATVEAKLAPVAPIVRRKRAPVASRVVLTPVVPVASRLFLVHSALLL